MFGMGCRSMLARLGVWAGLLIPLCAGHPAAAMATALSDAFDVRVYDQADGLDYFTVSGLAATPDGLLWMATFRDLARYDGMGFSRVGIELAPEFGRAQVRCTKWGEGGLWLGGGGFVGVFGPGSWRYFGPNEGVPAAMYRELALLPGGEVWAAWESGMIRKRGDRFEGVEPPPGMGGDGCSMAVDEGGRLWCSTRRGLWWREGESWHGESLPEGAKGQGLCGVLAARGGGVWLAMDREVWRWRDGKWDGRRERPEGMREDPVAMLEDSRGGLWVGGWVSGLMRFDPDEIGRAHV